MVANASKSGTVMFRVGHHSLFDFPRILYLYFSNVLIPQNQVIKILGVLLNTNLSYKPKLSYLQGILSRQVGVLHRVKSFLSVEVMFLLYYALFNS